MIHCPKGIFKGADTYLLKYVPGVLKSAIKDSSLHTELLAIQKKCIDIAQHRHKQWHFFRKLGVSNSHLEKIIFVLQNSSRQWFKLSQVEKKKKKIPLWLQSLNSVRKSKLPTEAFLRCTETSCGSQEEKSVLSEVRILAWPLFPKLRYVKWCSINSLNIYF